VVIGAGSGIGRAVAADAANAGATLILGGRTAAPLKETARLAGGTVCVVDASLRPKRVGVPAEQANAVLFALTSPFLTGSVLPIDGGALFM
jgi:NAD(P)-dependent dehydrogenase (short-subunit alcohol dehydrogenase family)